MARILDNENAEILGSSVLKTGAIGAAMTGFSTVTSVLGVTSVGCGATTGVSGVVAIVGFTTSVIE
ncbi:hypothetical protein [Flavobacterium sp. RSSB_23]|uniref:hypothetical protein n=1 Tax=Flavobacterium sp. RSSB_23 TaxID=3447668 RepID=UPI003F38C8F2